MRTAFSVSSVFVLLLGSAALQAAAPGGVPLPSGGSLTCTNVTRSTVCTVKPVSGSPQRFTLQRDTNVRPNPTVSLKVVGSSANTIVFVDSYPSKPAGLNRCQAGKESFLRVVSLSGAKPSETFHTKLESCQENVELALDGLHWDAATRTLHIHWLSAPGTGNESEKSVQLDQAGKVLP